MPETLDQRRSRLVTDPVQFARHLVGIDLWETQLEILRAIAESPRVAVKACHASSKTFTAAVAALWWVTRYPDGVVLTTAPTWTQVQRQLWPEIHRLVSGSRLQYPEPLQTELRLGPERYILGLSTDRGVRFQGYHGRILVIIDEAPGVDAEIWEAIEGIRAGGAVHVLALGNPTVPGGPFYDAFSTHHANWRTFTISAFDTPNLRGLQLDDLLAMGDEGLSENERPYLIKRDWVREKWEEWGKSGAPQWYSRVLGEFPPESEDALFQLAWLSGWQGRVTDDDGAFYEVGIDVAGPGRSETVMAVQRNGDLVDLQAWNATDPRGAVLAALAPYRSRLSLVRIDSAGIGYNFALHVGDQGYPVLGVNVGAASWEPSRFQNLKAQLYWSLRERAENGSLGGLRDELAYQQLASLRFEYTSRGLVAMESKDAMVRRGLQSPDRAEALMLAYAPVYPAREAVIDWDDFPPDISPV